MERETHIYIYMFIQRWIVMNNESNNELMHVIINDTIKGLIYKSSSDMLWLCEKFQNI